MNTRRKSGRKASQPLLWYEGPVVLPDGDVVAKPDHTDLIRRVRTGSEAGGFPAVIGTAASARESLDRLRRLVRDFPFADRDRDFAHWLSMALAIAGRHLIEDRLYSGVPVYIFESDVSGIGKSLLAEIAFTIGTAERSDWCFPFDRSAARIARDTASRRKRCALFHSVPDGKWQKPAIQFSSSRLRASYRSEAPENWTVFALSGEDLSLGDHEANHTVAVRLRSGGRPPKNRSLSSFAFPQLIDHVREFRKRYHADCLEILSAYLRLRPDVPTMAVPCEYQDWSDIACRPLAWLGLPHPQVVDYVGLGCRGDTALSLAA